MGELIIRRKLKNLRDRCVQTARTLDRWAWLSEDDARERLRKLQQLDVNLLDLQDDIRVAITEVSTLMEFALADYGEYLAAEKAGLSEAERAEVERLAEVIQLADRRAA